MLISCSFLFPANLQLTLMQSLKALPKSLTFEFEGFLIDSLGIDLYKAKSVAEAPLPGQQVCKYYLKGSCHRGASCSFFHPKDNKTVVCKHYLRGLCSKGDRCEFLHEVYKGLYSVYHIVQSEKDAGMLVLFEVW